jgi:hypothetical protein
MLVLTIFVSVCMAAVLFLLRFFFALESEIRAEHKRAKVRVDHVTTYQTPAGIRVQEATPVFTDFAQRAS